MSTIMIVAGGSGGHISPGLAIADEWMNQHPTDQLCFVTSGKAVERFFQSELKKYDVRELAVPPLKNLYKNPIRFFSEINTSYHQSHSLIRELKPRLIIGMGAMTSVPLIFSAWRNKIPIFLHEQNKIAGRATKFLARFSTKIFTTFDQTSGLEHLKNVIYTGNPLRQQSSSEIKPASHSLPVLLILGGSQGARHLNLAIAELIHQHPEILQQFHIIHQTGSQNSLSEPASSTWEQHEFLQPIASYYAQANSVICRAGAGTLSELANWKLPAILVPYPQAVQQHQLANAQEFTRHNAALLVTEQPDPAQTAVSLWNQLLQLQKPEIYNTLQHNIHQLATPQAAQKICQEVANSLDTRLQ